MAKNPEEGGHAPGQEAERLLAAELTELRRGWALASDTLVERLGPNLVRLAAVPAQCGNQEARRRVQSLIDRLVRDFAAEDRLVVRMALGVEQGTQLPHLTDRTEELARRLHCSDRSARRKINRAFALLAQAGAAELGAPYDAAEDADESWYVRRFEAMVRLDLERPEVTEHRTIVARWDGVHRISARFSVPRRGERALRLAELDVEPHFGARIAQREQQSESHFKFALALPRPLSRGEEHEYELSFRLPPGWPLRPHYAFVPLVSCESFLLRVRFDPDRPPAALWRLEHLAHRALEGRLTAGRPLHLDPHGEAVLRFDRLEQGFAYGIEWLPFQQELAPTSV